MEITKEMIKFVQGSLNIRYGHNLVVDGDAGKKTQAALMSVPVLPTDWTLKRKLIGYGQHICALKGINAGPIDGYAGPQTEYGFEQLRAQLSGNPLKPWRDDEGIGAPPSFVGDWPRQTQSDLERYYGPVGTNQTKVDCPYPVKIAWDTDKVITRFTCHEKVADSIVRVMTRVKDHYGDDISDLGLDLWGGCLNVRPMRGGTRYSTHSWGMAIDWDSARNPLRANHTKANFAKPVYNKWWELWEEEGWVSLGRERDYDWMHVQAAKVR